MNCYLFACLRGVEGACFEVRRKENAGKDLTARKDFADPAPPIAIARRADDVCESYYKEFGV